MKKIVASLDNLSPLLIELINDGIVVKLGVTGNSMLPLLTPGRDSVLLKKAVMPLVKGNIILYKRANGQYVLHRIIKAKNDNYVLCGDNQCVKEYGISFSNVIAVVTAIERNGKVIGVNNKKYKCYSFLRISTLKLRKIYRTIKKKLK